MFIFDYVCPALSTHIIFKSLMGCPTVNSVRSRTGKIKMPQNGSKWFICPVYPPNLDQFWNVHPVSFSASGSACPFFHDPKVVSGPSPAAIFGGCRRRDLPCEMAHCLPFQEWFSYPNISVVVKKMTFSMEPLLGWSCLWFSSIRINWWYV